MLSVVTAENDIAENDDCSKSRQIRKGPARNIAAPFQPSPTGSRTPKVCPLTYRDRPSSRIDYMSCHFQELDAACDITYEKVASALYTTIINVTLIFVVCRPNPRV